MYKWFLVTTDVIFSLSLFAFLFLLARYASEQLSAPLALRGFLIPFSFAFFVLGMIENLSNYPMLSDYPQQH